MNTRAIILAAGEGKRFDATYPKCFIDIGGFTIIDRLIGQFHHVGIRDIYVVTRTGIAWRSCWRETLGAKPVSSIIVGYTVCAFDSFREAMTKMDSSTSTVSVLGDCVVDTSVIERLATNHSGILVIKYPPGEMKRDDDYLGMSIPGSELPKFLETSLTVDSMRHQDFFINHAQGLPIRMPSFATKPWVNVNRVEDVQEAQEFLKTQEEKGTDGTKGSD